MAPDALQRGGWGSTATLIRSLGRRRQHQLQRWPEVLAAAPRLAWAELQRSQDTGPDGGDHRWGDGIAEAVVEAVGVGALEIKILWEALEPSWRQKSIQQAPETQVKGQIKPPQQTGTRTNSCSSPCLSGRTPQALALCHLNTQPSGHLARRFQGLWFRGTINPMIDGLG